MWRKPRHQGTIDCRQVEAALTAYLKGGLSAARRQAIDEHLAACETCTRSLQQTQVLESELRIQAAHHNPTLSATASARINERVYRRMRRGLIMQRAVKVVGVAVAVVAIALLAVGAMALWQERPSEVGTDQDVTPESGEGTPTFVPATVTAVSPTRAPQPTATGTATPAPAQSIDRTYDIGDEVWNVITTDLDGDDYPDLVVPDTGSGLLRLLFNRGDGTFQDSVDYTTGEPPLDVVAADLNSDSYSDLVVAHWPADDLGKLSILLNNGDGTFQDAVDYVLGYGSWWVRAADLDGDSDLDLVTGFLPKSQTGEDMVGTWLNDGDGAFSEGPQFDVGIGNWLGETYLGDLDGDSIPDLVLTYYPVGKVTVHMGNGDATFRAPVQYRAVTAPIEVVIADLNGDSYADLAIPTEGGTLGLLLNNGDGTFQEIMKHEIDAVAWRTLVVQLDGDGYPDLLVPDLTSKAVHMLLNGGDGSFQQEEGYQADFEPGEVLVTDLDGDSQPELLIISHPEVPVDGHAALSVQPLGLGE